MSGLDKNARESGDAHAAARTQMVREQLASPDRNIKDSRVLEAMARVPRHRFVPQDIEGLAYSDRPLPIGREQTISQPFIVALMTEALQVKSTDRVLEIGTGSGYQAAVLGELAERVFTVEIVAPLGEQAAKALGDLGCSNVRVRIGDGHEGWPEEAPFDAILVACAPEKVPQSLVTQLKDGGRMVIPVGTHEIQKLVILRKEKGRVKTEDLIPVRFVPMTGGEDA